jgi:hypothetical protein
MKEQQQPHVKEVPLAKDLKVSKIFLMTINYILMKKFKWRVIPPHLKKP